jgi:hypothetical protein
MIVIDVSRKYPKNLFFKTKQKHFRLYELPFIHSLIETARQTDRQTRRVRSLQGEPQE